MSFGEWLKVWAVLLPIAWYITHVEGLNKRVRDEWLSKRNPGPEPHVPADLVLIRFAIGAAIFLASIWVIGLW